MSILCDIFKIYEDSCLRRGQFIKLGKSKQKEFDGISQVIAHQQSRVHQSDSMYLSGSQELDKNVSSHRGVVDAKPLPQQRTITEALKITKPDSQSSDCRHFFENPDTGSRQPEHPSIDKYKQKTFHLKIFMTSEGSNENTIITLLNRNCQISMHKFL